MLSFGISIFQEANYSDVIFQPRGTAKLCAIVNTILRRLSKHLILFINHDNYSLNQRLWLCDVVSDLFVKSNMFVEPDTFVSPPYISIMIL